MEIVLVAKADRIAVPRLKQNGISIAYIRFLDLPGASEYFHVQEEAAQDFLLLFISQHDFLTNHRIGTDLKSFDLHEIFRLKARVLFLPHHHAVFIHHIHNAAISQPAAGFPLPHRDDHRAGQLGGHISELQPVIGSDPLLDRFFVQRQDIIAATDPARPDHIFRRDRGISVDIDLFDAENSKPENQH